MDRASAHLVPHHTDIKTWVAVVAVITTKKSLIGDSRLTRPMHVIASQRIPHFLVCFSRCFTYLSSTTETHTHHHYSIFRDCAVATSL